MATILYKGGEVAIIEADQVPNYLKNGWSVEKEEKKPASDKAKVSSAKK